MYYNYQDKLSFLDFFFLFAAYDSFYSIFDLEMLGIDGRNLSKIMWKLYYLNGLYWN